MPKQTKEQQKIIKKVMHEFKEGELESSSGQKVTNPKQAIAIGLHEAGASKYESEEENKRNLARTRKKTRARKRKTDG